MTELPVVTVNAKALERVEGGHPWIYATDVLGRGSAQPGQLVRVTVGKGRNVGVAHFSSTSQITLRMLARKIVADDAVFLRDRVEQALAFRKTVVSDSDAYRLIHAEADLLPGLIVDRYQDWVAAQFLTQGMNRLQEQIIAVLVDVLQPKGIVARNDAPVRAKENLPLESKVVYGDLPPSVPIRMNRMSFQADLLEGQKTGVFLDQRENYLAAARYGTGRALDCFTSTGGFALHLSSKCESVEAVDSSSNALATAARNAEANGIGNVQWKQADVLHYLPGLVSAGRSFDIVVVDPPAFTKSRAALEGATRGYKEVNLRALRLLRKGGILVSCSCSHHMSESHLLEVIAAAALDSGKTLRVLERRTQAQDHPILLTVPETHYLKCLILQVM